MALDKKPKPTVDVDLEQSTLEELKRLAKKSDPPSDEAVDKFKALTYGLYSLIESV